MTGEFIEQGRDVFEGGPGEGGRAQDEGDLEFTRLLDRMAAVVADAADTGADQFLDQQTTQRRDLKIITREVDRSLQEVVGGEGPPLGEARTRSANTSHEKKVQWTNTRRAAEKLTILGVSGLLVQVTTEVVTKWLEKHRHDILGGEVKIKKIILPLSGTSAPVESSEASLADRFYELTGGGPKLVIEPWKDGASLINHRVLLTNAVESAESDSDSFEVRPRITVLCRPSSQLERHANKTHGQKNQPIALAIYLDMSAGESLAGGCAEINLAYEDSLREIGDLLGTIALFLKRAAPHVRRSLWERDITLELLDDSTRVLGHALKLFSYCLPSNQRARKGRACAAWLFLLDQTGKTLEVKTGSEPYPRGAERTLLLDLSKKAELGLCGRAFVFQETRVSRDARHDPRVLDADEEDIDQAVAVPLSETVSVLGTTGGELSFGPGVLYVGVRGSNLLMADVLFIRMYSKVITQYLVHVSLMHSWRLRVRGDLRCLPLMSWYIDSETHSKALLRWLQDSRGADVALILLKIGRERETTKVLEGVVPRDGYYARLVERAHHWVTIWMKKNRDFRKHEYQLMLPDKEFQPGEPWTVQLYQRDVLVALSGGSSQSCLEIAKGLRDEVATRLTIFGGLGRAKLEVLVVWLASPVTNSLSQFCDSGFGKSPTELTLDRMLGKLKADADLIQTPNPILVLDGFTGEVRHIPVEEQTSRGSDS